MVLTCASSSLPSARSSRSRSADPLADAASRFFERLAQTELQLAGGLFREGDGDDPGDFGPAGFDDAHDAPDQLGGFAGAGGGFDDQRVVERRGNLVAIGLIGKRRAHGRPLNSIRSAICSRDLRRARRS